MQIQENFPEFLKKVINTSVPFFSSKNTHNWKWKLMESFREQFGNLYPKS